MEDTVKTKTGTQGRWLQLAVGVFVMLFAGIIYSWSILKAPFTSVFGWTAAQLGVNYTITIACFCTGGFISGLLSKRTSARLRLIVGALLTCAGFIITSRLNSGGLAVLYVAYGVLSGFGIGITYNTVLSTAMAWFPDKKGMVTGALLMGFALTTLIIGNIAGSHMGAEGWRGTYLILAIVTGCVILAASFVLRRPSGDTALPAPKKKAAVKPAYEFEKRDYTAIEMVKRPSFWMLFIFLTILAAVGNAAISFAKDILIDMGSKQSLAVLIVGIISLFNGLGRLIAGALFDNIGIRKTQYITSVVSIAATLTVVLALGTKSLIIGVIGLALCYFTYGFVPTSATTISGEFYGPKNHALNMSIATLHMLPASFIATLAGNLKTATGSFESTFLILVVGAVVALGFNLGVKKP